jgi:hypothetical protein
MDGTSHIGMAELAFDGLVAGMQPVAEGDGLLRADPWPGMHRKEKKAQHQHHADHTQAMGPRFRQMRSSVSAKAVKNAWAAPGCR